jgi:hypothetical protein
VVERLKFGKKSERIPVAPSTRNDKKKWWQDPFQKVTTQKIEMVETNLIQSNMPLKSQTLREKCGDRKNGAVSNARIDRSGYHKK